MVLALTKVMHDTDYCRDFPDVDLLDYEDVLHTIEGLSVEVFLTRFPEFKVLLQDSELSEDFINTILLESKLEIELGQWSKRIEVESVYLLTAHNLQTRFEQQAKTASIAVSASQGKGDKPGSSNTPETATQGLVSTIYGVRLTRLQAQSRQNGGIVLWLAFHPLQALLDAM